MKDLGAANYISGMEIKRVWAKRKLWSNQRKYVEIILQRFNMQDSKPMKVPIPIGVRLSTEQCPKTQEEEEDMSRVPYESTVGSLMYAMVYNRPDIALAVGVLSSFMSKPGKEHWTTVKWVFRYLRGTSDYGLCYQGRPGVTLKNVTMTQSIVMLPSEASFIHLPSMSNSKKRESPYKNVFISGYAGSLKPNLRVRT